MADKLEIPESPEELVLAIADDVNPNRPLYSGDVFTGVRLPVLGPEPLTVVVVSHPCAVRAGARLRDHLHVAPLVGHSEFGRQMWTGNYRLMALDTLAAVVGLTNPVVRLDLMTLVATSSLDLDRRVACLDRRGVNILRQRLVYQLTRVVVAVWQFDAEASGAHEEVDLLESWLDEAVSAGVSVEIATADFHSWLQVDGRQGALGDPSTASTVRRTARSEIQRRFGS